MKKILLAMVIMITINGLFIGCMSYEVFTLVPKNHQVQPKKIAVISGIKSGPTALMTNDLTKRITEVLAKKSRFNVITHDEIKQKLPNYPTEIVDFSFKNDEQRMSMAISRTAKAKVDELQKVLKTDYVLLIWVDKMIYNPNRSCTASLFGQIGDSTNLSVHTRLFQYPGGYSIGYSSYYPSTNRIFFEDLDNTFGRLVGIGANKFVSKFVNETKTYKKEDND